LRKAGYYFDQDPDDGNSFGLGKADFLETSDVEDISEDI
jgi:hypothetical protein